MIFFFFAFSLIFRFWLGIGDYLDIRLRSAGSEVFDNWFGIGDYLDCCKNGGLGVNRDEHLLEYISSDMKTKL